MYKFNTMKFIEIDNKENSFNYEKKNFLYVPAMQGYILIIQKANEILEYLYQEDIKNNRKFGKLYLIFMNLKK